MVWTSLQKFCSATLKVFSSTGGVVVKAKHYPTHNHAGHLGSGGHISRQHQQQIKLKKAAAFLSILMSSCFLSAPSSSRILLRREKKGECCRVKHALLSTPRCQTIKKNEIANHTATTHPSPPPLGHKLTLQCRNWQDIEAFDSTEIVLNNQNDLEAMEYAQGVIKEGKGRAPIVRWKRQLEDRDLHTLLITIEILTQRT